MPIDLQLLGEVLNRVQPPRGDRAAEVVRDYYAIPRYTFGDTYLPNRRVRKAWRPDGKSGTKSGVL
jgi:hypothetical protein